MPDLNQIMADLEQYKASGGDMAACTAAYNALFATGKTPLGLNQWQRSDKPMMEDFNEDNRICDRELQARYTKGEVDGLVQKKADMPVSNINGDTGYIVFSNKTCIQWGVFKPEKLYSNWLAFPIAFKSAPFLLPIMTGSNTITGLTVQYGNGISISVSTLNDVRWIAIGPVS